MKEWSEGSKVLFDESGIYLKVYPGGNYYSISWDQIKCDGIAHWVKHLCEKNWITVDLIREFVECAMAQTFA